METTGAGGLAAALKAPGSSASPSRRAKLASAGRAVAHRADAPLPSGTGFGVDTDQLDARFVGRAYDRALLAELPAAVDPCGENGEIHTFVTDGPAFAHPVPVGVGPPVVAGRFARVALTPVQVVPGTR